VNEDSTVPLLIFSWGTRRDPTAPNCQTAVFGAEFAHDGGIDERALGRDCAKNTDQAIRADYHILGDRKGDRVGLLTAGREANLEGMKRGRVDHTPPEVVPSGLRYKSMRTVPLIRSADEFPMVTKATALSPGANGSNNVSASETIEIAGRAGEDSLMAKTSRRRECRRRRWCRTTPSQSCLVGGSLINVRRNREGQMGRCGELQEGDAPANWGRHHTDHTEGRMQKVSAPRLPSKGFELRFIGWTESATGVLSRKIRQGRPQQHFWLVKIPCIQVVGSEGGRVFQSPFRLGTVRPQDCFQQSARERTFHVGFSNAT